MANVLPRHYRLTGLESDLPLLVWPDNEGEMIVQIGRSHPISSWGDKAKFSAFVTDLMWTATPVHAEQYHVAMQYGVWPDGTSSKEIA